MLQHQPPAFSDMDACLGVDSETASAASSICDMRLVPAGSVSFSSRAACSDSATCNSINLQPSAT
jgi:hypothetical protein